MVLFALLIAPVFLLFWISFPQNRLPCLLSVVLSLITGGVFAAVRYLLGAEPRFHDFGRSLYGTILLFSIVPPVVLPSAVFFLLRWLHILPPGPDRPDKTGGWAAWLLFALIPYGVIFALSQPEPGTVKPLVLLPFLWVVQIVAAHFFVVRAFSTKKILLRVLFGLSGLAVPFLCAAAYRAWFAKESFRFVLFLLPLAVITVLYFVLHTYSREDR
jgi:hypothetical protein